MNIDLSEGKLFCQKGESSVYIGSVSRWEELSEFLADEVIKISDKLPIKPLPPTIYFSQAGSQIASAFQTGIDYE